MIELAYIQKQSDHGEFLSEAGYTFWHGCQQLGIDTKPFFPEQIEELELRPETVVYGGIGMVRRALERLGAPQPRVDGMPPEECRAFYGRRIWATTMAEVREGYEDNRFFFIKPLKLHKAFVGHVTSGNLSDLAKTATLDNDFEVMASEVVTFRAEYRLFVHRKKVIGCRFYSGDFRVTPDFSVADHFLQRYQSQPVAYSLDLGVTDKGETLVVEINDSFSLGAYGLSSIPYTKMVTDRWEEMVSSVAPSEETLADKATRFARG